MESLPDLRVRKLRRKEVCELPKVTQLVRGKGRIPIQTVWPEAMLLVMTLTASHITQQ